MRESTAEDLVRFVRDEQVNLWTDFAEALRYSRSGDWSIAASGVADRIVASARLVGPAAPDDLPWVLVGGNVYETLLNLGGIEYEPLSEEYLRSTGERMREHGGTWAECLRRYAGTVAAMRSEWVVERPGEAE